LKLALAGAGWIGLKLSRQTDASRFKWHVEQSLVAQDRRRRRGLGGDIAGTLFRW
jgi:hypothetical protein